jgi:hypothetical protein
VNETSVQDLFKSLRREKVGEQLGRLEVLVGIWESRFEGRDLAGRLRKRVARYTCDVDEDGREMCKGKQMRYFSY